MRGTRLAEQAGSRSWALFIAPAEPERDHESAQQRLIHAVRSGGLGSLSLPAFWRLNANRVSVSRVLVVYEIDAQRAVRLARRYAQVAVVHVQRVPYEDVVLLNVTNEQSVQQQRYKPGAIADALASMFGAATVAIAYRATGVGESQLMGVAERRLWSGEPQ